MVCVCCMHVYIFMCTCISTSRVFLYHSLSYSFWGRSLTEPKHQFSNTSWSVSTRDPCLCVLPCWDYRHSLPHLTFYIVARDPKLGPHAYMASILLIEASPSLCLFFLQKSKIYKDDHSIVLAENQQLHFFPQRTFHSWLLEAKQNILKICYQPLLMWPGSSDGTSKMIRGCDGRIIIVE